MQQNRKAILGLFLVLIGVVLLLDNLSILPRLPWWIYEWYTVMIVIGILAFFSGSKTSAIIFGGIGLAFLFQDLFYFSWRDFWPVILIIIGLSFFFRKRLNMTGSVSNENYFDSLNIFGGGNQKILSHKLEGGKVTTIFGGAEIDLRESRPISGAQVEIFTMFGGIELFVPEDWNIKVEVTSIFGGFEDHRKNSNDENAPLVIIKGVTLFGGGEIKA